MLCRLSRVDRMTLVLTTVASVFKGVMPFHHQSTSKKSTDPHRNIYLKPPPDPFIMLWEGMRLGIQGNWSCFLEKQNDLDEGKWLPVLKVFRPLLSVSLIFIIFLVDIIIYDSEHLHEGRWYGMRTSCRCVRSMKCENTGSVVLLSFVTIKSSNISLMMATLWWLRWSNKIMTSSPISHVFDCSVL